MANQALDAAQVAALSKASPTAIEDATVRLRPYLSRQRWLGNNNRYLRRAVETVKKDAAAPQNTSHKHLSEYVAASAALHCADGWAYLGRALSAHSSGDSSIARHLAYYAELRAALSLLATQGIGIFSGKNAVIDPAGEAEFFRGPTHVTTWLALEYWADSPVGSVLLSELVRPGSVSLSAWIDGLGLGSGVWSPIGRNWLRAWGLDLRMFGRDRDTRNEASYRPTSLRGYPPDSVLDAEFVRRFWPLFEPAPSDPFYQLDRHLLRLSMERAFESTSGQPARGNVAFLKAVERSLLANSGVGIDSPLGRFIARLDDPATPLLFESALKRASHLDPRYHVHAISRAALLLRVATGASARVLEQAQLTFSDFRFWTESLAEAHGLCGPGTLPDDPADLWADVDEALFDFAETVDAGSDLSFFALRDRASVPLGVLTGCTRVAVWGLAA